MCRTTHQNNRETLTVADAEFFPVVVTGVPADEDHAPLLADPVHARLARAGEAAEGDLILASLDGTVHGLPHTDYFNDQYEAHPDAYDPTCQCGVCRHFTHEAEVVVISRDHWESCDPWNADDLMLIVPAERLA